MSDDQTEREKRRAATKAKTDKKLDAIGDVLGTIGKRVSKKIGLSGGGVPDDIYGFWIVPLLIFLFMAASYIFRSSHLDDVSISFKFLLFGIVAVVGFLLGWIIKWWWNRGR